MIGMELTVAMPRRLASGSLRVIRGVMWLDYAEFCGVANCNSFNPENNYCFLASARRSYRSSAVVSELKRKKRKEYFAALRGCKVKKEDTKIGRLQCFRIIITVYEMGFVKLYCFL